MGGGEDRGQLRLVDLEMRREGAIGSPARGRSVGRHIEPVRKGPPFTLASGPYVQCKGDLDRVSPVVNDGGHG